MYNYKIRMDEFIKKLLYDIETQKKINTNPSLYINQNKLIPYIFNKSNINENDIPIQCTLGSSCLIKGKNIIEIYSWCDYRHSLYIQINKMKPVWLAKIRIINTAENDPENLEFILDGFDSFYLPSSLHYEIIQFIEMGFELFIKI